MLAKALKRCRRCLVHGIGLYLHRVPDAVEIEGPWRRLPSATGDSSQRSETPREDVLRLVLGVQDYLGRGEQIEEEQRRGGD